MSSAVLESRSLTFTAPPVPMADLFPFPARMRLIAVEESQGAPDLLQMAFDGGATTTFSTIALRDACCCTACRHPESLERTLDQQRIHPDIRAERLQVLPDGDLEVVWIDGHVSRYQAGWLEAGGLFETVAPLPPGRLWDRSLAVPHFDHEAVVADPGARRAWLEAMVEYGLVYVIGAPVAPGEVGRLIELVGPVRPTNFGTIFDVRAVVDAISNAYTANHLPLHVDLPTREYMPGYQFLHCIANEALGGASVYGDAFAMAEDLRAEDPDAFRILCDAPARFRYHDRTTENVAIRPVLATDRDGHLTEVRFNPGVMTSFLVPAERMREVWRAYQGFVARTRDPAFQVEVRMRPGDIACFDNRRVLHGRRAFEPSTGLRHLQGAYLEREDLLSTLRVLQRPVTLRSCGSGSRCPGRPASHQPGSIKRLAGRTGRRRGLPG